MTSLTLIAVVLTGFLVVLLLIALIGWRMNDPRPRYRRKGRL